MKLIRVETDKHKVAIRNLSIEYLTILLTNLKEHHNYDADPSLLPAYTDEWLENELDKFLAPKGYFFLALVDNQPVGMGALKKLNNDTAEIKRMYVSSDYRGRKIGKALLNKLIDVAKADGYQSIMLDTFKLWDVSPRMYQSAGFVEIDPHPYAEPAPELIEHCIFMELKLS